MSDIDKARSAHKTWEETKAKKAVEKNPEQRPAFTTVSGLPVDRLYVPEERDYVASQGFPGEYPFTRGVQPTMYRGRHWTMRQYAGFGSAKESNERYRFLLGQGQTGLSVAFDLPTQIGYDSDQPLSEGEVGKVGVAVDSLADMEVLFDQIPLDKVSTSMTINAPAAVLLAMYVAVGEKQGVPAEKLEGTIQNDVLKEYIARGTYIFPPRPSMRLITDIFSWCSKTLPRFNTISISGYHIREAGSTAPQEVAFTLADGMAYVKAAVEAGLPVDAFASRLSFFFAVHNEFFEEVAKFRAARRIWAKLMKERFGAKDAKSLMLRFHTQTGGSTLTAQQPLNNVVRVAIQALSSVLGGTQSLHTNSYDEALCLPSEESVRVALRTQQVIAHESGVCSTIDPLGGSYYVESLTDRIEAEALRLIDEVDKLGGAVAAVEKGYFQREIQKSAYRYQTEVDSGSRVIVGMNKFQMKDEKKPELTKISGENEKLQRAALAKLRASRDNARVKASLEALRAGARGSDNLLPLILESVRAYATLGEVCGVLREEFGEYKPEWGLA